jgi:hypothetical protein
MKLYEGVRTDSGRLVTVDGSPLDQRNHSPDGAEWGYGGSGPAQLAVELLADATGDEELAKRHYQRFTRKVVAGFERDRFLITQAEIRCWIAARLTSPDLPRHLNTTPKFSPNFPQTRNALRRSQKRQ